MENVDPNARFSPRLTKLMSEWFRNKGVTAQDRKRKRRTDRYNAMTTAAETIQNYYRRARYNPDYRICKRWIVSTKEKWAAM